MSKSQDTSRYQVKVNEPPFARWLFSDTRSAPLWLVVRVWLGLQWLGSGWGKIQLWDFDNGKWINGGGVALKSYWERATAVAPGGNGALVTYDWYYDFLKFLLDGKHYQWFSWLVAFGEIAIGLGLVFGCLTGIAALFGAVMNISFVLAGTTSTNGILLLTAIALILAWKTAGQWGLDRYVLKFLGTPWSPGKAFSKKPEKGAKPDLTSGPQHA